MGFVKSNEELAQMIARESWAYYDAEMLFLAWETKPQIVERLLPPPLKPTKEPIAIAFVGRYPRTNFEPSGFDEAALFLWAEFSGEKGIYCLSMPVEYDIAMAAGREIYGFPKKMANVELKRSGDSVTGWAERYGVRFFEVKAKLDGKPRSENFQNLITEIFPFNEERGAVNYNFKNFPAPTMSPEGVFDYNPRLVKTTATFRPHKIEWGNAEVKFIPNDHDPWAEVEVVRVLGAVYTVGNNVLLKGDVVAEVDQIAFAPYAFLKWDIWP